jgi:streptomycin 6-kinase
VTPAGRYQDGLTLKIPARLAASCGQSRERARWLAGLPSALAALEHRWRLRPCGPLGGADASCSYLAAVKREDGTPAVLKIGMPHMEGEHEIAGLRFWDGNPTVRLLLADEGLHAMLLERCQPGTALGSLPESEQDTVVSRLLHRLWRLPPGPLFRPLSALTAYWSQQTLAQSTEWCDSGLVREGLRLFDELPRSAPETVTLATDLHAGNILRAEREPWLVIDPKPFVGDPAFDATQHLFNCPGRLRADARGTIRHFARLLGVDHERVRLWTLARAAAEPRNDWSGLALAQQLAR